MANLLELDSLFFTALKLLHSKAKGSEDQLKALLNDVLGQRGKLSKQSKIKAHELFGKKEAEKRALDKLRDEASEAKKMRLHSSVSPSISRSHSASPDIISQMSKTNTNDGRLADSISTSESSQSTKLDEDSESTDIEEEQEQESGEFALNMGNACVVCKSVNSTQTNQLVECQECHNLYHQVCHKPMITESSINDPRLVWYCVKCAKNMKKINTKNGKSTTSAAFNAFGSVSSAANSPVNVTKNNSNITSSASFASAANQGRETALQLLKAKEKAEPAAIIQPFKRIETKSSGNSVSSAAPAKSIGLAGFAANLNRINSTGNVSDKGNNESGSTSRSTSNLKNTLEKADKRLQIMKKKQMLKLKK